MIFVSDATAYQVGLLSSCSNTSLTRLVIAGTLGTDADAQLLEVLRDYYVVCIEER